MPGLTFDLLIDDREVEEALAELLRRMESRRGFYAAVGKQLAASSRANFKRQSAPDGTPWQKLKASTVRKRTRQGQLPITILQTNSKSRGVGNSGSSLLASINDDADNDGASVGVPQAKARYGAIHQFGGTINMPARKGRIYRHFDPSTKQFARRFVSKKDPDAVATDVDIPAYSITMPARPFLGVSPADEGEILILAQGWLGF